MGLTREDTRQLLQLGSILLPIAADTVKGFIEAPAKERLQKLQEQKLAADIQRISQPEAQVAIPAQPFGKAIGMSTTGLADPSGNVPIDIARLLAHVAANAQNVKKDMSAQEIKKQELGAEQLFKQQKSDADRMVELRKIITAPTDIYASPEQRKIVANIRMAAVKELEGLSGKETPTGEKQEAAPRKESPVGLHAVLDRLSFDEVGARKLVASMMPYFDPLKYGPEERKKQTAVLEKLGFTPDLWKELINTYGE